VGGLTVASGLYRRPHRCWLWWLAFGHGVLFASQLIVEGRRHVAMSALTSVPSLPRPPWYTGWIGFIENGGYRAVDVWPWAAELLLAALVLGVGWWRRKRRANVAGVPEKERIHV
jgi:hypothetical protein